MGRKNRNPHPRRFGICDRLDLDYVSLPEYPQYMRIIVKSHKTIYINLAADFTTDAEYVVKQKDDPMMRKLIERTGNKV